ncbi:MAG: hypothetical protein D6741_08265, partial [Planctomycetota bacterium]
RAAESQRILNEIAAAKVCLLNPERKAAYDAQLRTAQIESMPPLSSVAPEGATPDAPIVSLDDEVAIRRTNGPQPWIAYLVAGSFSFALLVGGFYLLLGRPAGPPADVASPQPTAPSGSSSDHVPDEAAQPDSAPPSTVASSEPTRPENVPPSPEATDTPSTPPAESIDDTPETDNLGQITDYDTAVARLREAMAERNVDLARQLYRVAEQLADSDEQQSELEDLRLLYEAWRSFWRFAESSLDELAPGTPIEINGEQAVVVESSSERLVLQRENGTVEYTRADVPAELLVRLAETKLPEGPSRVLAIACFWYLDHEGSPDRVRDAVLASLQAGFPRDNLPASLLAIADAGPDESTPSTTGP